MCCGIRFGIMMICILYILDDRKTSISNLAVKMVVKVLHDLALSDIAFN